MVMTRDQQPSVKDQASPFVPVRMIEVELGEPLPALSLFDRKKGQHYQRARCLVRLHTQPLGLVELEGDGDEIPPGEYAPRVWEALSKQINTHLLSDGLPTVDTLTKSGLPKSAKPPCLLEREQFLAQAPFVSVIVPTHERPDRLAACLDSLLALEYPKYEIIVVDNAPTTNTTVDLIKKLADSRIRYIREDRQGPSWARNCGIEASKAEILAFTDDDVVVDRYWLASLIKDFAWGKRVVCVTGLVLPMELETPAQFLFEGVGGYNKGFQRRIFDFQANQARYPLHPYVAERFGTGASMALKADFLRSIGGFDPALGRVGPVRCSQDIAVFFQVIARGKKIMYDPASVAYHSHRREYEGLTKQTFNHSVGYTAYLIKSLLENPRLLLDFTLKIPYAFYIALKNRGAQKNPALAPYEKETKELLTLRRKGLLYGPIAFVRSQWELRTSADK